MIKVIKLKNFKPFADCEIPLSPLTLLMGENGAGKSSVFQSILVLKQSADTGAMANGEIALNGVLCELGTGRDALHQGAEIEEIAFELVMNDNEVVAKVGYAGDLDALPVEISDADISAIADMQLTYLQAERVGPRLINPHVRAAALKRQMGSKGEGSFAVLSQFRDKTLEENDPRVSQIETKSVGDAFQYYIAKISKNARVDFSDYGDVDGIGVRYTFSAAGAVPGDPIRPTNVGFGISYVAPIVVACLVAEPGDVLMIENPEAHLHTSSQRSVMHLLALTAAAGVQVLVETHSRELYHWLRNQTLSGGVPVGLSQITYIESDRTSGSVKSICHTNRPGIDNLTNWPSSFAEEFGSPTDLIAPI